MQNEFLNTRAKILAKIQELEPELQYWREELKAFERVETTIRRLGSNGNGKLTPEENLPKETIQESALPQRGDLKRRVLKIVLDKAGKRVSSTDVVKAILQSGYLPTGKHFDISVYQTLLRLADEEDAKIEKKKLNGKVRFSAIKHEIKA